ncbi:MAG: peptidase M48 [Alphaproteobacteria bacterium]|nr:MAG: peptidase M48 [Alphaproteobacteria bacterium]
MKSKFLKSQTALILIIASYLFSACDKETGFNLFTLQQDREFGEQMDSVIRADPAEYPILNETSNAEAYQFMNDMMNAILQSDDFVHKDDFNWKLTIIDKEVMNAFAVPGGNIYFYTGLMKYLDNAANLAGVLAHEMAHVDRRHSTEQLTKVYGIGLLLNIITGNDKSQLEEIAVSMATGLSSLKFSRDDEYEADEYSVKFLADTDYHPKGISGFFEKLRTEGQTASTFEFLSTHPDDENRLENIDMVWIGLGSPGGEYYTTEYENFKNNVLP